MNFILRLRTPVAQIFLFAFTNAYLYLYVQRRICGAGLGWLRCFPGFMCTDARISLPRKKIKKERKRGGA